MEPDIKVAARKTFANVLESATLSQVGGSRVYGNSLGHSILAEREEYRSRWAALEEKVKELKDNSQRQVKELKDSSQRQVKELNQRLGTQVQELKDASQGYLLIRQRFLDTFRRDILKDPEAKWTRAISEGNKAAHHGDAVTDAGLFNSGSRKDDFLMLEIYGLSFHQILSLSKY